MKTTSKFICYADKPDWLHYPPLTQLKFEMADNMSTKQSAVWNTDYAPVPVFIGQFGLPDASVIYLFGIRFEYDQTNIDNPAYKGAHLLHYLLCEYKSNSYNFFQLSQQNTVTYTVKRQDPEYVLYRSNSKELLEKYCLTEPPKWKKEDANWPLHNEKPMTYITSFSLPENEVTLAHLTYNKRLFLFYTNDNDQSIFKITTQNIKYQSAEDHYRLEEKMAKKAAEKKTTPNKKATPKKKKDL